MYDFLWNSLAHCTAVLCWAAILKYVHCAFHSRYVETSFVPYQAVAVFHKPSSRQPAKLRNIYGYGSINFRNNNMEMQDGQSAWAPYQTTNKYTWIRVWFHLRTSTSLLVFIRLLLQLNCQTTLWLLLEDGITVYVWLSMALDQNPLFLVDHKNRKCNFLCPF